MLSHSLLLISSDLHVNALFADTTFPPFASIQLWNITPLEPREILIDLTRPVRTVQRVRDLLVRRDLRDLVRMTGWQEGGDCCSVGTD